MSLIRPASKRLATLVAAATAGALVATGPAAHAATAPDPQPATQGADWLKAQLTDGLIHNEQYDFDDIGLSIDVAFGLRQTYGTPRVAKAITKAVAPNVSFYTSFPPSIYAGATAKAAVLAEVQGKNPRSFGGVDLIAQLEGRVATTAPIAGRIQDAYDPTDKYGGDFANVFGQAYAAGALSAAKSPKADLVRSFLLQQQCDAGYFRQDFTADRTRTDQSCQGAPRAERGASTDTTAAAASVLFALKGPKAKQALKKALAWLVGTQRPDGSFTDTGTAKGTANANSTGQAGLVLGLFGRTLGVSGAQQAARKAATWVRNLQVQANPCAGKLGDDVGAIALDADSYGLGEGAGITKKTSDQWRRASAQALPVLQFAPRAKGTFGASAPAAVKTGTTFRIGLAGVAPGQRVCVTGAGSRYEFDAGPKAMSHVSFAVGGAGPRTYRVWAGSAHRDVTVRVTG